MKPQPGLTDNGKKIFDELVKHIEKYDLKEIDSYNLTELAHQYDLAERCRNNINYPEDKKQKDGVQKTSNGYTQVTGYVTVMDKCNSRIEKLGAKYGMTPADRDKIKSFTSVPQKKQSKLAKWKKPA